VSLEFNELPAGYQAVVSSNMKAVAFKDAQGIEDLLAAHAKKPLSENTPGQLEVMFNNGARWAYRGVALGKALELLKAPSKGKFFNAQVKNNPAHPGYSLEAGKPVAKPAEPTPAAQTPADRAKPTDKK